MEKLNQPKSQQDILNQQNRKEYLIQLVTSKNAATRGYYGVWKVVLMDKTEIKIKEPQAMELIEMIEKNKFICIDGSIIATHQIVKIVAVYEDVISKEELEKRKAILEYMEKQPSYYQRLQQKQHESTNG